MDRKRWDERDGKIWKYTQIKRNRKEGARKRKRKRKRSEEDVYNQTE